MAALKKACYHTEHNYPGQFVPTRILGPVHYTRLHAPHIWTADHLLDLIIKNPLHYIGTSTPMEDILRITTLTYRRQVVYRVP